MAGSVLLVVSLRVAEETHRIIAPQCRGWHKRHGVVCIKFIRGIKISLTKITIRIRDTLMMNYDLMEILQLDGKTILKPLDWNHSRPMELSAFPYAAIFTGQQ